MSALVKPAIQAGPTASRPVVAADGTCYFDTTLGQPIWASSSSATGWVDATGSDA